MDTQTQRKLGNIEQLVYIRRIRYEDGHAAGMQVLQVKNGALQFTLSLDKGLDILEASYKGINLSFLSGNGLSGGAYTRAYRYANQSVMGGMCFTCGPDNVGPADQSRELPLHGSFRMTAVKHLSTQCFFDAEGQYRMRISGEVDFNGLFQEHICLTRTIETVFGSSRIDMTDQFQNKGFEKAPCMLLYHWNFAYPFLDDGCIVHMERKHSVLREKPEAETDLPYMRIDAPEDDGKEQVFFHDATPDDKGLVTVTVENPMLQLRASLRYRKDELPKLLEWKSMVSGDYVLGIEPANCLVFGRAYEEHAGTLPYLAAGESRTVHMEFWLED